ncbi:hypothetical protein Tco_0836824 [Tanacetum coccineum]
MGILYKSMDVSKQVGISNNWSQTSLGSNEDTAWIKIVKDQQPEEKYKHGLHGKGAGKGTPWLSKAFHVVFQIALWAIWKWRNRIVAALPESISKVKDEDIFPSI